MDVVRAAVAEVEDYERIEVRRLPRLAVSGAAVADLTHLLAELIENAAVFSPPHTQVRLHGEPVANGFVLEIDDRGLGLTPDALLEANLRLAETPEFELSDTDRLGLFVVSRLAQRHGVRVSLRQSPYGGTTAVVLVPANLLTETGEDTGSTRIEAVRSPPCRPADPEHTFRKWGLDSAGGERHKEHAAHPRRARRRCRRPRAGAGRPAAAAPAPPHRARPGLGPGPAGRRRRSRRTGRGRRPRRRAAPPRRRRRRPLRADGVPQPPGGGGPSAPAGWPPRPGHGPPAPGPAGQPGTAVEGRGHHAGSRRPPTRSRRRPGALRGRGARPDGRTPARLAARPAGPRPGRDPDSRPGPAADDGPSTPVARTTPEGNGR